LGKATDVKVIHLIKFLYIEGTTDFVVPREVKGTEFGKFPEKKVRGKFPKGLPRGTVLSYP
jgi:hypothetical protein